MASVEQDLKEYEDGMAKSILAISIRRREAQAKLLIAYPSIVFNAVEAHGYLNNITRTNADPSLPNNFKTYVSNLSTDYGYNISISGMSFSGYSLGPMTIGGIQGQEIAKQLGSLLHQEILANDTDAGARLYSSHLCSYVEYQIGEVLVKVTNPGSANAVTETVPPNYFS